MQTTYPIATCERGTCVGVVPVAQPWTECMVDADCVALPRDCTDCLPYHACEWPRAYYAGVARAHEREYTLLVCGPERELPRCEAGSTVVRCVAGRCQVDPAR